MATWKWYGQGLLGQGGATAARRVDFTADTLKVMFATSAYTPDQDAHDFRNDVTNEVTGTGYSSGGVTVAGQSWTYDSASNEVRLVFNDVVIGPGASVTGIRVGVLYKSVGTSATDPLIGYIVLDGDQTVSGGTYTLDIDATTALKITAA